MGKFLVTGGCGFIGAHVTSELLRRGESVTVVDNFSTGQRDHAAALRAQEPGDRLTIQESDVRTPERFVGLLAQAETVIHLAALPSVPRSYHHPTETFANNTEATRALLHVCQRTSVRRLVFASSSSVYGEQAGVMRVESMRPAPQSPYARSKWQAEQIVRAAGNTGDIETVVLRYFNVFGPGQRQDSVYSAVIPRYLSALCHGRPLPLHGDGRQGRDFTYVGDVVRATLLAATRPLPGQRVFNVGTGQLTSVRKLIETLRALAGKPAVLQNLPKRRGDVFQSCADISAAKRHLKYRPEVTLALGLERAWACGRREWSPEPAAAAGLQSVSRGR